MKLNKKQKRTATIASMAALLAVVLGMGGQTFAKYISTDNATSQATVAKWGLVVNVDADSLIPNGTTTVTPNEEGVNATAHSGIVYPGQNGKITIDVTGCAEVDAALDFTFATNWKDVSLHNGTAVVYNPITWSLTLNGGSNLLTDLNGDSRVTLEDAQKYFENYETSNAVIAATTTPREDKFVLSWNWPLEANNKYDTYLGNLASSLKKSTYGDDVNLSSYVANSNLSFNIDLGIAITQAA